MEKKTISKRSLFWLWFFWNFTLPAACSYVRYYGVGFATAMAPLLRDLYGDNKEELIAALKRHSTFFVTEMGVGGLIPGISIAMEEERAAGADIPDEAFITLKSALMGPLAGIGDSLFDSCFRTLLIAIFTPLAAEGMIFAPIVMWIVHGYIGKPVLSIITMKLGRKLGKNSVDKVLGSGLMQNVISAFSVMGMFLMGALTKSYVSLKLAVEYVGEYSTVNLQSVLDKALPGILQIGPVLLIWFLMRKKVNTIWIILGTAVICILGAAIGIF